MLDQINSVFTKHAAKLAFCIGTQSYTYEEWLAYVCGIRALIREKRPEGLFIGLAAYDDIETYAAILAIWAEGYAFVPLSPQNSAERNVGVMKQVESTIILSSRSANELLVDAPNFQWLNTSNLKEKGTPPDLSNLKADQILCMLFTSGSTGVPKGVPMTTRNINTTLAAFFEEGYQLNSEDRFLQMFELTFDMSMISYLPAWCIGASVHTVSSEGIKYLNAFKVMQEQEISFVTTVPSTLQLLRPYFSQINLPNVRYSLQGGEPFYTDLAKAWMDCVPNAKVINLSGPCETTMACMSYPLDKKFDNNKHYKNILAFGRPWNRTRVLLLNENDEVCQADEEGELCFAGEHVMKGYWQMPEKNNAVFIEKEVDGKMLRFYRSGDMAFSDKDGIYFSTGRKDIQYKIQGYKVELGDIEQHAKHFLTTGNAVAQVDRNEKGLLDIHLFIDQEETDIKALSNHLDKVLPSYMQPRSIRILKKLPLTVSGKLDRKRVASIFAGDDFEFLTNRELAERVTDNLFSTYTDIAKITNKTIWQKGNLKAVDSTPSYWPTTSFGTPTLSETESLTEAMMDKSIPPRLILLRPVRPEVLYHKMTTLGFQHMVSWPGMALDLNKHSFSSTQEKSAIVKTEKQLKQWFEILNEVLFVKHHLEWSHIKTIWDSGKLLFYGLSINEKIVAIALGFPKDKGVGIYMVAVKEEERRKGYALALMKELLADVKGSGYQAVYLQATKMGFGLYEQLGFIRVGDFDIFSIE